MVREGQGLNSKAGMTKSASGRGGSVTRPAGTEEADICSQTPPLGMQSKKVVSKQWEKKAFPLSLASWKGRSEPGGPPGSQVLLSSEPIRSMEVSCATWVMGPPWGRVR